jgi:uncharacterized protein YjdB
MARRRALSASLIAVLLPLAASVGCAPKPASIRVSAHKMTIHGLKRGGVAKAEVVDKKGTPLPSAAVTWESSKPSVATIDGNGLVKAVGPGKSILKATHANLTETIQLEVIDVGTITIAPLRTTLTGGKGAKTSFSAEVKDSAGKALDVKPVWSSTNPAAATIDAAGTATAVSEGRTGIVASLGEITAPADLTVLFRELASFEVSPPTILLKAGDSQKLTVVARDGAGNVIEDIAVVWSSSDPKTAVVGGGILKGISPGSTSIRSTCGPRSVDISVVVLP